MPSDSVVWLDDDEISLVNVWFLSLESDAMGKLSVNYQVVRDLCDKENLYSIEVFGIFKRMGEELKR